MDFPDDEVSLRILGTLDRQYEEEFDMPVSPDTLAKELQLDRATIDRQITSLLERGLVRVTGAVPEGYYHVTFVPMGKDEWDRRQGDQRHLVLRRRILETLREREDQGDERFITSENLASELRAGPNAICLNIIALEGDGFVELMEMGGGVPSYIVGVTPEGRAEVERTHE